MQTKNNVGQFGPGGILAKSPDRVVWVKTQATAPCEPPFCVSFLSSHLIFQDPSGSLLAHRFAACAHRRGARKSSSALLQISRFHSNPLICHASCF